jgi:cell wall assembly regulator SMI1
MSNEAVDAVMAKHDWPTRTAVPTTTVEEVEQYAKLTLPADYKSFLLKYTGSEMFIGDAYVVLWDLDDLIADNDGYSIIEHLTNTLAIGGNGSGECIAIQLMPDGGHRVVLTPFSDLDADEHIEIGTSFTDFLVRMDEGRDWFDDDDEPMA